MRPGIKKNKFNLKLGAMTTPGELTKVFTYNFMKYELGVWIDYGDRYRVDIPEKGYAVVDQDSPIVYLGFKEWKVMRHAGTK